MTEPPLTLTMKEPGSITYVPDSECSEGDQDLHLHACGLDICKKQYRIERRRMESYCIEVVMQGTGYFRAGGETRLLLPGSVFVYGGDIAHSYWTDSIDPMHKLWVCLRGAAAQTTLEEALMSSCGVIRLAHPRSVVDTMQQILYHAARRSRYSGCICRRYLDVMLLLIQEQQYRQTTVDSSDQHCFHRIKEYLDIHFARIATIKQLGRETGVSPSHVSRLFRRYHHASPHRCLLERKLDVARYKLRSTSQPIKQIASELGFRDGYEFSRVFKRAMGMAPSSFRGADGIENLRNGE